MPAIQRQGCVFPPVRGISAPLAAAPPCRTARCMCAGQLAVSLAGQRKSTRTQSQPEILCRPLHQAIPDGWEAVGEFNGLRCV